MSSPPAPALIAILAFNASNQLAVRRLGSKAGLPFTGTDLAMATARLESSFREHTAPAENFSADVAAAALADGRIAVVCKFVSSASRQLRKNMAWSRA